MDELQIRRILVATDLSHASEPAMEFAADLAARLDAEIILFHALPPVWFAGYGLVNRSEMEQSVDDQIEETRGTLGRLAAERFRGGRSVTVRVVTGSAIESIRDAATRDEADLIVMGTHGYHPGIRHLLGSVAQGVLRTTSRPVITVPLGCDLSKGRVPKILCPVDFSLMGRRGAALAAELGRLINAEVIILHLVGAGEAETEECERSLRDWLPHRVIESSNLTISVLRGDPAEEVVRVAKDEDVGLIVLSARRKIFADVTAIGTTTERVIRHAPCPVLTSMCISESGENLERTCGAEPDAKRGRSERLSWPPAGISRRIAIYVAAFAALAIGAPLGALLIRMSLGADVSEELSTNAFFYLYMLVGTLIVFTASGWWAGRRADDLGRSAADYRALSELDELTGLQNIRWFDERYTRALEEAERFQLPLSLMFIDLDHLKRINDDHGHQAGSAALLHVARMIMREKRESDDAARWGGDEFAVLMKGADAYSAERVARAIIDALRDRPLEYLGTRIPVNVTIGIATTDEGLRGDLLGEADARLQRGKAEGRDRIVSALPASGPDDRTDRSAPAGHGESGLPGRAGS
ncbi:MAG TPA: universal stress protein [Thermoanaerobaculia bacterium]|nr:universal stress protein [Thermoanaerobaculia bacterium]